jgi:gamma-glutamylcyclotransferase
MVRPHDETQENCMTFRYFAYGSNMLTEWLRGRCPSAQPIGIAIAANHKLVFGKRSIDKSGKATLVPAEGNHTPGVVFEIAESERGLLDTAEGFKHDKPDDPNRYKRDDSFQIRLVESDSIITATTYLANKLEDGLKPYDWYLALLIAGAVQYGLDSTHIKELKQTESDKTNDNRQKALSSLKAAGHENYAELLLL